MTSSKIHNLVPDTTLLCSIILAYIFDHSFPIIKIIPFPANLIGWLIIVAGVAFAVNILQALKSKRTSTDAAGTPSEFITDGPYRLSRNPFYLSYVVIATGTAFVLGSLTAFVAPVICFAVIHFMIIPLEERNLQKKFGQQYVRYKKLVRRWI
jgi:protein-S-isoprenylcysteine O-methyltransferase Ste14